MKSESTEGKSSREAALSLVYDIYASYLEPSDKMTNMDFVEFGNSGKLRRKISSKH